MTPSSHFYAVVRRMDGRLEWKYSNTGFTPAAALYVTTSLSQAEEFIARENAIARERADQEKRAANAQLRLFS